MTKFIVLDYRGQQQRSFQGKLHSALKTCYTLNDAVNWIWNNVLDSKDVSIECWDSSQVEYVRTFNRFGIAN